MAEELLTKLLLSGLPFVLGWVFNSIKHKNEEDAALKLGLQALLRDRIIQAYNHYAVDKHWIPIYAKESLETCFQCYEDLGANGVIDDLMEQIKALPNYNKEEHHV